MFKDQAEKLKKMASCSEAANTEPLKEAILKAASRLDFDSLRASIKEC